jgi:hypothetical protein
VKNEPTNENMGGDKADADVGVASKDSNTLVALVGNDGKTEHVRRPRNLFSKLGFSFKRRMFWKQNKGA